MTKSRTQMRADLIPALAKAGRSAEWRAIHPERKQTLIPVLPDDTVNYVMGRLADAGRTAAMGVVVDGELRVVWLTDETHQIPDLPGGAA